MTKTKQPPHQSLYKVTEYKSPSAPHAGTEMAINRDFIFSTFDAAYRHVLRKKKNNLDFLTAQAKKRKKRSSDESDTEISWAFRIQRYDVSRGGGAQEGWCFDYRGHLYSSSSPTPSPVSQVSATSSQWLPDTIVALCQREHFHFGVIKSVSKSDFEVMLPLCGQDGTFETVRCEADAFLPYDHEHLEDHIEARLISLLAIEDLGTQLIARTRKILRDPRKDRPELAPECPPLKQSGKLSYFTLEKTTCSTPHIELTPMKNHHLGFFNSKEGALDAMSCDIKVRTASDTVLRYSLDVWVAKHRSDTWGNTYWHGSWSFDNSGRYLGWNEFGQNPFHGRRVEDRAFNIGDLVSVIDHHHGVMPALVISTPRTPETVKKGMDTSDDRYFVSGIRHRDDGWIDADDFAETYVLPLMSHLTETQIMNLASQLLTDEEQNRYLSRLKKAPSLSLKLKSNSERAKQR